MVEYLYNCIRATAGSNVEISAIIQDANGADITEGCHIMLFNKDCALLDTIDGAYIAEIGTWQFTLPAEITKGKVGRYWYRICSHSDSLCFKQPIYFIE